MTNTTTMTAAPQTIEQAKMLALMMHLGEDVNATEIGEYDRYDSDYLVLTDDEANEEWEASLDNYLEECIYPELPDNMRYYFDEEKWKRDARYDGRGHSLSSYDGNEYYETVFFDGQKIDFYIYRIN